MGAPSQQQIDEAIAEGLARGEDEEAIAARLAVLERISDDELAAVGVYEREDRNAVAVAAPVIRADLDPPAPPPFEPAPTLRHRKGWSAERQRLFNGGAGFADAAGFGQRFGP